MTTHGPDMNTRAHREAAAVIEARAGRMERLGPPMLTGALPATVELPDTMNFGLLALLALALGLGSLAWLLNATWEEGLLAREEGEPLADYASHLLDVALTRGLFLPLLCLVAAAGLYWAHRNPPNRVRISLSREAVRVEDGGRAWTMPVAGYAGVTLRHRKGFTSRVEEDSIGQSRGRITGQGYASVPLTLWWVELVHPDPMRSIPVWASLAPTGEEAGRRIAASLSDRLGLPLMVDEHASGT